MGRKPIYRSRKFLVAMIDGGIGLAALLISRFMTPEDAKFLAAIWALWQPVVIIYIGSVAWEDSAAIKAGTHPNQQQQ